MVRKRRDLPDRHPATYALQSRSVTRGPDRSAQLTVVGLPTLVLYLLSTDIRQQAEIRLHSTFNSIVKLEELLPVFHLDRKQSTTNSSCEYKLERTLT